jgi:phage terminase large subunit-like protein
LEDDIMTYHPPAYMLGLDLGKKRDFTALAVLKQSRVPTGRTVQAHAGFDLRRGAIYESVPELQYVYDLVHLDR